MATLGFKLLRALSTTILFGVINFLTAGLGACLCDFIEYHGNRPEMLGWGWYFLLIGSISLVLGSGGLLVTFVYVSLYDILRVRGYLFFAIQGILFGTLFLLSMFIIDSIATEVLPDRLVLFILVSGWFFFTGISVISCIFLNKYIRVVIPRNNG